MDVLIIGAGIAGLSAAIALGKQNHRVVILEKSGFLRETGAAIHLPPNCTALLKWMGVNPESFGGTLLEQIHRYDPDGNLKFKQDFSEPRQHWQAEWYLVHRVELHNSLKERALETAELHLRCKISKIDIDSPRPSVVLEDGRVFTADLVLGADGLHSQLRTSIAPEISPYPVGTSCLRWLLPIEDLKKDECTKSYVNEPGLFLEFSAKDRRLVAYPCSNNNILNICAFMPSVEAQVDGQTDEWQTIGNTESVLQGFSEFAPSIQKIIQGAEQNLKVFDLFDMEDLPTWVKGHAALLGDAAHPFQPYMGQGGAMAIEDAVSIATLLPLGSKPQDIPTRLAMYQSLRRPRVNTVLNMTRLNGRREDDESKVRITRKLIPMSENMNPGMQLLTHGEAAEMVNFMRILFSHNERETSQGLLVGCQ